jgi:hypothetical protein
LKGWIDKDVELLKELLQPINDQLDKHSIILEELKKNMNTVIEGQQAQAEQTDRHLLKESI